MSELSDVRYILIKPEDREVISRFTEAVEALREYARPAASGPTKGQVRLMQGVLQRKPFGMTDRENEVNLATEVLGSALERHKLLGVWVAEDRKGEDLHQITEEFLRWHAIYRAAAGEVCEHPYLEVDEGGICQRCGVSLTIKFRVPQEGTRE